MFETTPTPAPKSLSFHEKRNCSPKAYEYLNKRDEAREKKITLYEYNQLQTRTVDFFIEKEADLQSCYKDSSREYYACAVVGINSKAKIEFLDVADEVNKLSPELKNCLEKKLQSYNYKSLKATAGTKFAIPVKFAPLK
jgi:prolyl-tRNA synthetase